MTPASSIPSGGLLSWGLFSPHPLHLFLLSRGGGRKEILGLPLEARGAPTLRLPMTSQDPEDFSDNSFFPQVPPSVLGVSRCPSGSTLPSFPLCSGSYDADFYGLHPGAPLPTDLQVILTSGNHQH